MPFAWNHEAVDTKALTIAGTWEGVIEIYNVGLYIENYLLIVIGGIPWQVIKCFIFLRYFGRFYFYDLGCSNLLTGLFSACSRV